MGKNSVLSTMSTGELPYPEQAFEWPQQAIREKDWHEAARRWAVLRHAYPRHAAPWFQGAEAYAEADEWERAHILLNEASQRYPDHPGTLITPANFAIRRQQWAAADRYLQQAREKHPEHLLAWMKSAECAEGQHKFDLALAYNEQAREHFPDRPAPWIQHAELAENAEQWEEALQRWEIVRERFPMIRIARLRATKAAQHLKHNQPPHLAVSVNPVNMSRVQAGSGTGLGRILELIWTKAVFNLRSEVQRSFLSYFWWLLEPLMHMTVYYVVFGMLLQRGGEGFITFLLTGLIPWMWFMKAVTGSSGSILSGQNLMLQVGLPSIVFPLVSILQATLKQVPVFLILMGFVWLQGYPPSESWLALPLVILVQAFLIVVFACAVAAVIPFMRDLSYLVPTGMTFMLFLSGIFYDYASIPADWQSLFLMNPMAFLLKCYREIFIVGTLPDLITLSCWGIGSAFACALLIVIYQRLRYTYPRVVTE